MRMKLFGRAALPLFLAAIMSLGCLTAFAAETPLAPGITLRVEGVSETYFYDTVTQQGGTAFTVLNALKAALDSTKIPYVEAGSYVSQIGEDTAGAFGGWDGWVFYVNGQEAAVGMAEHVLKNGDDVLVCYADPYGDPPTLLPQAAVATVGNGYIFTFTAQASVFGDDGSMSVNTVPVADAAVTIAGRSFTTDAKGQVSLPRAELTGNSAKVQIAKKTVEGKPLVVPFAPDFTVELPAAAITFPDISAGAWYREYVRELVELGAINGYSDGTFRPTKEVTRAEFIKILVCTVEGFDVSAVEFKNYFSDVTAGSWYAPYIVWAVDQGIIDKGGSFSPNVNLKRQDMALIAYNFASKVLGKAALGSHAAPAFVDDASIAAGCREAVYFLQRAGVIEGVQSAEGFAFVPEGNSVRSEISKVIIKLIHLD